ncbi:MAG TPA: M48 family metalloprotease [Gaiellaceae bacterium]|nr:M48 family metalloprotease [Gaiellaceae bacterium]
MALWLVAAYLLWPTDVPGDLKLPSVDETQIFDPALLDETEDFERFLRWNDIASNVVLLVVLVLFAWRGWRFARESAAGRIGTGMLLGMIGLALVWIAQLPFAIAGIWWQKRYDIVTAGYLEWVLENWLVLGAQFLFICLWLLITMALAAPLRDRWWLAAAPVFAGLALLLAFLTPYLVPDQRDPDPGLAADGRRIARATGQQDVDLKVQEIGDLTEAPNAFAAGLGPSRRVVLWDTLLEPPFDREEVRVVIAHEYGHHESGHIWKGLAWYALVSLPILFVVARVARRWGGLYQPRAVPVALLALVGASLVVQPFDNLITRRMEMEADWVALETTKDPDSARELFEEFADTALQDPDPPEWAHVWFDTHPSIVDRIAEATAWEQRR